MLLYKNGKPVDYSNILTTWMAFDMSIPSELTVVSGNPTRYCRCRITTTSGVFESSDNITIQSDDQYTYKLQYLGYEDNVYEYVGYNIN